MVINTHMHALTKYFNYMFTTGHSNYKEKKQTFILFYHCDPQAQFQSKITLYSCIFLTLILPHKQRQENIKTAWYGIVETQKS